MSSTKEVSRPRQLFAVLYAGYSGTDKESQSQSVFSPAILSLYSSAPHYSIVAIQYSWISSSW